MHCPTCSNPLTRRTRAGQQIDLCSTCGGVWADAGELAALIRDRTPRGNKPTESHPLVFDPNCPRCDGRLAPFEYAHDSGVTIARCHACGGLWVGESQLDALARYRAGHPALDRLEAALAVDHRRVRRWEAARSLLHSKWLSGVVAAAYLVAMVATTGDLRRIVSTLGFLILPLACIWFSDTMGRFRGNSGGLVQPRITSETPGVMVAIGGWLLLLTAWLSWLF